MAQRPLVVVICLAVMFVVASCAKKDASNTATTNASTASGYEGVAKAKPANAKRVSEAATLRMLRAVKGTMGELQ